MQKVFILAFLLICITAKHHRQDPEPAPEPSAEPAAEPQPDQGACIFDHCRKQLFACNEKCGKKIESCAPTPSESSAPPDEEAIQKVIACLKENPASWRVVKCIVQKCAPKQPQVSESTLNHLINYAKILA